jgi:hypothetical protein
MISLFILFASASAYASRLSVGEFHSCRVNVDQTLDCWGVSLASSFGQGNFARTTFLAPVLTPALAALDVVVGDCYTCYLDAGERLVCAGVLGKFSSSVFREPMPGLLFSSMVGARFDLCAQNADSGAVMCLGGFVASAACGLPLSSFTPPCEVLSPVPWDSVTQMAISSTHLCVTAAVDTWLTLCTGENGGSKHYFTPSPVNTVQGLTTVHTATAPSQVFVGLVSTCVLTDGQYLCLRDGLDLYTVDAAMPANASLCYSGVSLTGSDTLEFAATDRELLVRGREGVYQRSGADALKAHAFEPSVFSDFVDSTPFTVSSSSTLTCVLFDTDGCVMCTGREVQRGNPLDPQEGNVLSNVLSTGSAQPSTSPTTSPSTSPSARLSCEEKAQNVLAQCCLYDDC